MCWAACLNCNRDSWFSFLAVRKTVKRLDIARIKRTKDKATMKNKKNISVKKTLICDIFEANEEHDLDKVIYRNR